MGLGEVLEERDGGRRVIGEAVEEQERARVDRAADERVNLAERQRERAVGQPLMQSVHKSDQLQVEPVGHDYDERHPHRCRAPCVFFFVFEKCDTAVCLSPIGDRQRFLLRRTKRVARFVPTRICRVAGSQPIQKFGS